MSAIARVEVPAALWRKQRAGELAPQVAATLVRRFEFDFHGTEDNAPMFSIVALDLAVLVTAAGYSAEHGLRAYDSVQLASAVAARRADSDLDSFACLDSDLRTAAGAAGFLLIP